MIPLAHLISSTITRAGASFAAFVWLMIISSSLHATPVGLAIGVGSLGPGASVSYDVSEKINLRLGVNRFNYDFDLKVDDIDYAGEVQLKTLTALLDWHPWAGSFRLSTGLVSNANEINGSAKPSNGTIEFNGKVIDLAEAGRVDAEVGFNPTVMYAGFGWGNAARGGGISFFSDFGVLLQGEPDVDITIERLDSVGLDQSDIDEEITQFEDEVKGYKIYPVVSIGFAYNL